MLGLAAELADGARMPARSVAVPTPFVLSRERPFIGIAAALSAVSMRSARSFGRAGLVEQRKTTKLASRPSPTRGTVCPRSYGGMSADRFTMACNHMS